MNAIVAVYSDWGIGDKGTQPIFLHADRKHFASLTKGAAVICGRKTMEDFPGGKPLSGRNNIVITTQNIDIEGAEVAHSPEEAVLLSEKYDNCFVIGGASVFEQMLPYTDRVYITKIDCAPYSSKFFLDLDAEVGWKCSYESEPMEENGIKYRFCTYERI